MSKHITIWIGLDVHAKSIALAQFNGDAATPVRTELPNDPKAIARAFKRLGVEGEPRVCYEAGVCGYAVCRQLRKMGVDCVVVAPSLIPIKPGAHVKTDRRDAIKLARLYRAASGAKQVHPLFGPRSTSARPLERRRFRRIE